MRIIAKNRLLTLAEPHGRAVVQRVLAWFCEADHAEWPTPQDIKDRYASASFIGDETVVFNIGGNQFRLVVRVWYEGQEIYIKYFVTHAEYDRLDLGALDEDH